MMKKISALVLALAMVLAMGSAAFAADDTYTGSNNSNATGVKGESKIPITKGIIFFNANGSKVYEPNVTFSYAVEPDTALAANGTTAKVTDDKNPAVTRNVYPGPEDGVTGTTIAFSASNAIKSSAAEGAEVEETGNLDLDISKFSRPGIYRYLITESVTSPSTGSTDSEKLQAAGLAARDDAYVNTRYLDVYIHYNADGELEMYGAVIFKSASATPGQDSITTETEKTTGFEPGLGGSTEYSSDKNVDKYYTYDFTVKKTVSGSMADKKHDFPFYVSITNTITDAKYTYFDDPGTGTGVAETIASAEIKKGSDASTSSLKLKDGEYVKFVGVPSNQTNELAVVVKEFNDTYDMYTPSVTATKGTITLDSTKASTGNAMNALNGSDFTSSFTVKTNDVANQIITINNELTEISPTGVVLRVAPYVLMLAAGVVLLVLARRRKNAKEEA